MFGSKDAKPTRREKQQDKLRRRSGSEIVQRPGHRCKPHHGRGGKIFCKCGMQLT